MNLQKTEKDRKERKKRREFVSQSVGLLDVFPPRSCLTSTVKCRLLCEPICKSHPKMPWLVCLISSRLKCREVINKYGRKIHAQVTSLNKPHRVGWWGEGGRGKREGRKLRLIMDITLCTTLSIIKQVARSNAASLEMTRDSVEYEVCVTCVGRYCKQLAEAAVKWQLIYWQDVYNL